MIPIFDSLTHPTLTGRWLGRASIDASFERLAEDMQKTVYSGACAVGLWGIENYAHAEFIDECKRYPFLIPIAGIDPAYIQSPGQELEHIKKRGFKGVKIHPRFSGYTKQIHRLREVFIAAEQLELPLFYCTYMHSALGRYPGSDPFYSLVKLLGDAPDARVVLVHGGDVQLLKYAELVRFNPNLLLDLSMTILKYEGSSIDDDMSFLFRQFDRRICIGSDHPEYHHIDLRRRFDFFSNGLPQVKAENIAYRNLVEFLSL